MEFALLRDWDGHDVTGWLMSEKLDGWRLGWDGSNFITRQGQVLDVPDWFKAGMPSMVLDGELYAGKGRFNFIQAMIRDGWHGLTFEVFDMPNDMPFHARARVLATLDLPAHCHAVRHTPCKSTGHFEVEAMSICSAGGEGCVARNPDSFWKAGRDGNILRCVPRHPRLNRLKA